MIVSEVTVIPVKSCDGLVAFASCVVDGQIYLGSLGVHKLLSEDGYRITYPTKKIGPKLINYYHPITREAGKLIEQAILTKCIELFERSDEEYGRYSKATHTRT